MKFLQASFVLMLFLLLLNINPANVHAQNRVHQTWITVNFGQQEYNGDLGSETLRWQWGYDWVLGVDVTQYLSKDFNLEFSTAYGELDYRDLFNKSFANANAIIQLKPFRTAVQPFIGTGLGLVSYWGDNNIYNSNGVSWQVPVQAGLDFRLSKGTSFTLKTTYNRTFTDKIDDFSFDGRNHDDFMVYTAGLKFRIKKAKDRDGDGIKNSNDLCPNQYGESIWGCPDSDQDGIVDVDDECPTLAGRSITNGCPDSDRDGIYDLVDKCPEIGQTATTPVDASGCPVESSTESEAIANTEPAKLTEQELEEESARISENIRFEGEGVTLDSNSSQALNRLTELMADDPDVRLIIRTYTNKAGDSNKNLERSVEQAEVIKSYLEARGIVSERIFAFGYGEENPFANQDGGEGGMEQVNLQLYYPKQSENTNRSMNR